MRGIEPREDRSFSGVLVTAAPGLLEFYNNVLAAFDFITDLNVLLVIAALAFEDEDITKEGFCTSPERFGITECIQNQSMNTYFGIALWALILPFYSTYAST